MKKPGIFHAFRPRAAEYVVKGSESEEEFERKVKRGITLVRTERLQDQPDLMDEQVPAAEAPVTYRQRAALRTPPTCSLGQIWRALGGILDRGPTGPTQTLLVKSKTRGKASLHPTFESRRDRVHASGEAHSHDGGD